MQDIEILKDKFRERYGQAKLRVFRAPGRVNLIGEHTDYNGGFVLPAAIDREFLAVVAPTNDGEVKAYSMNTNTETKFSLSDIKHVQGDWGNYMRGVAQCLQNTGIHLKGFTAVVSSTVPMASGLSSSAALEVLTETIFEKIDGFHIDPVDGIKLCQKAENEFIGVKCGIMDQFISKIGKKDHALFLDCRSLEYKYVPLSKDAKIIIVNTGVKRALAGSKYNERRAECEKAVSIFSKHKKGTLLRDYDLNDFQKWQNELPEVVRRRAKHVISENTRVLDAIDALKAGNLELFGHMMYESHDSLKNDYEVSCIELDAIVNTARKVPGILGARMTGAGFGGCAVVLAEPKGVERFVQRMEDVYHEKFGRKPEIYVCTAEDGAGEIKT
jgi:galactokinase